MNNIETQLYQSFVGFLTSNKPTIFCFSVRYFLRYNGGLTYFEIVGPWSYKNYLAAAQRLGLSDAAMGYWELHIREDQRHGRWMLDDVALPLVDMYPDEAWQIVLGYDQEKLMGDRAGAAMVRSSGNYTTDFS